MQFYLDHGGCCLVVVGPQLCQHPVEPLQGTHKGFSLAC